MLDKGEVFNNIGFCAFCTGEEKNLLMEELALRGSFFFGVITEVAASALFFLAATGEDCIFCTGTEAKYAPDFPILPLPETDIL